MVFITQPSDMEVTFGLDEFAEFKCQHTLGSDIRPLWIINHTQIASSHLDLPENHNITCNGTKLLVKNVELKLNNTVYQCQLEAPHLGIPCTYRSTTGHLIIKDCASKI